MTVERWVAMLAPETVGSMVDQLVGQLVGRSAVKIAFQFVVWKVPVKVET